MTPEAAPADSTVNPTMRSQTAVVEREQGVSRKCRFLDGLCITPVA
jgi:hypothetical protein